MAQLRETLAWVGERSPFYRNRLAGWAAEPLAGLADLARLPFTTEQDLREHHQAMLCLSQDQVARVVTLNTSGTTAPPKRLYFSDVDLELTLDFFQQGMATMVEPGDRVLILLPGRTPDSVGDLLARALARLEVEGMKHGPVQDAAATLERALAVKPACLVGIPVQVLALAEQPGAERLRGVVKSVLLTTDYVPQALARRVRAAWGCEVFEHYGMTETGLGGAVDCRAHQGCHLRVADLYYEVVDPLNSAPLPPGQRGELVLTTLTRQAMPLLRYRTGDWGRLLDAPCPCGGRAPRLDRVSGRLINRLDLGDAVHLPMWRLDEALFALPGLLDFRVGLWPSGQGPCLEIAVRAAPGAGPGLAQGATEAVAQIPELAKRLAAGKLTLGPVKLTAAPWTSDGTGKRTFGLQASDGPRGALT